MRNGLALLTDISFMNLLHIQELLYKHLLHVGLKKVDTEVQIANIPKGNSHNRKI